MNNLLPRLNRLRDVTISSPATDDALVWNGTDWVNTPMGASGSPLINNTAYNATSWDGVTGVAPSKNAVRDKVETLVSDIAAKAPIASPTFTGTVSGVTASMVGLGSVDNTADTAKPVSTAQQTALNLKANIASPTFTGTVGGVTAAMVGAPSGSGTHSGTSSGTNTGDQDLSSYITSSSTSTFTNKRTTKRIGTTVSTATPSVDSDSYDGYTITALAAAITALTITGTPTEGQSLYIRIKDDGTARAIALGTTTQVASTDNPFPTITTLGKYLYLTFVYNGGLTKWVMTGKLDNV